MSATRRQNHKGLVLRSKHRRRVMRVWHGLSATEHAAIAPLNPKRMPVRGSAGQYYIWCKLYQPSFMRLMLPPEYRGEETAADRANQVLWKLYKGSRK